MDIETSSASKSLVDREKTCPFLLRTFVKVGTFHRVGLFEDNTLPTADEHQLFTWKDATLRELVTTLRALPPNPLTTTLRHSAARFQFRLVFADPTARGRIATKDLGTIHSRDLLPTTSLVPAQDNSMEEDAQEREKERERKANAEERTLEELRVQAGDWLCVCVVLPAKAIGAVVGHGGPGLSIRGGAAANGGRGSMDSGWGGVGTGSAPTHGKWGKVDDPVPPPRGGGAAAPSGNNWGARGRGGGGVGLGVGRGGNDDRRPRRDSPPRRGGFRRGSPERNGRDRRRSRSRTPPRRDRRGS